MAGRPSTNGANGARGANGRFAKGNAGGPGNPHARRVAQIRSIILEAVSEEDLRAIVAALVQRAKEGDIAATRELLDRLAGKPAQMADPQREELEQERLRLSERRIEIDEDRVEIEGLRI